MRTEQNQWKKQESTEKGNALSEVLEIGRNGTEREGRGNSLGKREGYFFPCNWEAKLVRIQRMQYWPPLSVD